MTQVDKPGKSELAMNRADIDRMSPAERLAAMEALWDSLMAKDTEIASPDWHRDVLDERKRKIESGQAEFISLEKLRASRRS